MDPITGAVVIAGLKYVGKPSADLVSDFLGRILAPTGDAIGTVVSHPIAEWQKRRVERAEQVIEEAAKLVSEAGLESHAVPGRVLLPLLERSSLEEEPYLHVQWIRLLARAASEEDGVMPAFVAMLGELSSTEARLLEWIYRTTRHTNQGRTYFGETNVTKACLELEIDERRAVVMVGNLVRLAVVRHPLEVDAGWVDSIIKDRLLEETRGYSRSRSPDVEAVVIESKFALTDLGAAFVAACSPLQMGR